MSATREAVLAALKTIEDPFSKKDIVEAGIVRALTVEDGAVRFVMEIDGERGGAMEPVRARAQEVVEALTGVTSVSALMTAHQQTKAPPELTPRKRAEPSGPQKIPGIERILAVASGKGGVGKSTVSANLAAALAAEGRRVGLLDADVYGPSQPRMLGISGRPASPDGKTILPLRNHGITLMSIGLMTGEDEAVVWRGPMLMGALQQMMNQVQWGALDVLIVDLPPGTGDVQMTLSQKAEVTGAIVVSTPQDVALLDARKALNMFAKLNTPVVGMIENMSTHICSNCGHEEHIFGHGGVAAEAEKLGVPLLAEVPLHLDIRVTRQPAGTGVPHRRPHIGGEGAGVTGADLHVPPLFSSEVTRNAPRAAACARAAAGCDAGLILWRLSADRLEAAIVMAPDVPLAQAAQMHVVAGVGLTNAFGALAPPEVAMHLHWDGKVEVNGADCGGLSISADGVDDASVPGWLVIDLWLRLLPSNPDAPGTDAQQTSLYEEGCADLHPLRLLEAWARHTLVWINRWEDDGVAPVHAEWIGLVRGMGEDITAPNGQTGQFLGVDDGFGMLLKTNDNTIAIPLTALIPADGA